MLNENIKTIRQNKGYKQEDLASRLHVTRQTISKWERGYSVPDAEMLQNLAEILEVSVEELLGAKVELNDSNDINEVVEQLARFNEQLVIRNRRTHRILKTIGIVLLCLIIVIGILNILATIKFHDDHQTVAGTVKYTVELNDEKYQYEMDFNKYDEIIASGGDAYIRNHTDVSLFDDVNQAVAHLEDYVSEHEGKVISKETTGRSLDE